MPCKDKQRQKEHAAKHYQKNKVKMLAKASLNNEVSRQRNKEYISNYLKTHPCVDCSNSDIRVLEFDHVLGTKFKNIADMSARAYSIKSIQEEIMKCDVRCANCHRIATIERRGASQT